MQGLHRKREHIGEELRKQVILLREPEDSADGVCHCCHLLGLDWRGQALLKVLGEEGVVNRGRKHLRVVEQTEVVGDQEALHADGEAPVQEQLGEKPTVLLYQVHV